MSLNLDKFKDELVSAWREVMDEKVATDWAMFGYDGQTFDLKVVSKGDGGLDELVEDFNSGKIMYGLCRVKLKEKNLVKVALINWQGEGAPLARKGTCANHVATIKSFFKGVHVTINARTDEDTIPDTVIAAICKATSGEGIKMSSNYEASGKVEPIGSCYKRVNPQAEINSKAKDDFWRKEEQEEERRKKDEQNKVRKFSQNEVKLLRRESQDYFHEQEQEEVHSIKSPSFSPNLRGEITNGNGFGNTNGGGSIPPTTPDSQSQQYNSLTSEDSQSQKSTSPTPMFTNSYIANEKAAALKASIPKRNSASENLVRQRIKSFDGGSNGAVPLGNRNGGASKIEQESESLSVLRRKQLFENGGASNITTNFVRRNPSEEITHLQQTQKKLEEKVLAPPPVKSPNPRTPTPEIIPQQRTPSPAVPVRERTPSPAPIPVTNPTPIAPQPTKAYNLPFHVGGGVSGKLADTINKNSENPGTRIENNIESNGIKMNNHRKEEDFTVRSGEIEKANDFGSIDSEPVTIIPHGGRASASPQPPVVEAESASFSEESITADMGLCARALYDYEAADDTEITFDPGEIISNIEQIDDGWWEGKNPSGMFGLFPSNYVELLN